MSKNVDTLPEGWSETTIKDIVLSVVGGGTPSKKVPEYYEGTIPWFSVKDMKSLRPSDSLQHITEQAIEESSTNLIPSNTVAIATRIGLGKAIKPTVDYTINQDLKALILPNGVDSNFILYWIVNNEKIIAELGSGTTVKGIRLDTLYSLQVLLPPPEEQTRIVEKLEELLSDLDNGVAELRAAQIKLTQYRQSLLKSAVEGSLTEQWRKQNPVTETGEQLLQRILTERRQRWEQQKLAEFKEKNRKQPKDWQKKYPEPVQPDPSELPELPEGWAWASIDQLALNKRYGSSSKTNDDSSGIPVLRMGNIQDGQLDYSNLKYLPNDHKEFPDLLLSDGDLLFNRTNSAELVGKTAVYRDIGKPCSYASYLISVSFSDHYLPEIAACFINSAIGKEWVSSVMNQTAGQANVNGTKLGNLTVPVPPQDEQKMIVEKMNLKREEIDDQLSSVGLGINHSEAQRKNILKDAFSGKLVEQTPDDEPASVLLEKIKVERAELAKQPKPKRPKKKANNKTTVMEKIEEVLKAKDEWMDAQKVFEACGVTNGTDTDRIEELYSELRKLDKAGKLLTERKGKYDRLKLKED